VLDATGLRAKLSGSIASPHKEKPCAGRAKRWYLLVVGSPQHVAWLDQSRTPAKSPYRYEYEQHDDRNRVRFGKTTLLSLGSSERSDTAHVLAQDKNPAEATCIAEMISDGGGGDDDDGAERSPFSCG
jgi:hypothetical protein